MSETSMQRLWTLINLAVEAHEEDSIESPFDETTQARMEVFSCSDDEKLAAIGTMFCQLAQFPHCSTPKAELLWALLGCELETLAYMRETELRKATQ